MKIAVACCPSTGYPPARAHAEVHTPIASPGFAEGVREAWAKDVLDSAMCKDVPRLARRICITTDGLAHKLPAKYKARTEVRHAPPAAQASGGPTTFEVIAQVCTTLCELLEPERCDAVRVALATLASSDAMASADMALVMHDVVAAIGHASPVVRVLNAVHQGILLHGVFHMKQSLLGELMTRDMRDARGWRVAIDVSNGHVNVTHTRREQSADAHGDTRNHWELEWELCMRFDAALAEMTAARLRITDLTMADTIEEELAARLRAQLVGDLIVM